MYLVTCLCCRLMQFKYITCNKTVQCIVYPCNTLILLFLRFFPYLSASETFQTCDQTSKRKDFRRMKAAIYKKNRQDSNLEKAARDEKC